MNPFTEFLETVEATDAGSDALFIQCLDSPYGDKFEILQFRIDTQTLVNLINATESAIDSNGIPLEDQQIHMRRVAAVCLSVVKNTAHPNIRLTALKELLLLSSVPGSKGNGISTPNVLGHITAVILQVASNVTNGKTKSREPLDEEDSTDLNDEDDHDEREAKPSPDVHVLLSICQELVKFSSLFLEAGSSDLVDNYVDVVVALLYLGSVKSEYAALKSIATGALDQVARRNALGLISIMRCLFSSLNMRCDDSKIPESNKARLMCHKSAVKLVEHLVSDIYILNNMFKSPVSSIELSQATEIVEVTPTTSPENPPRNCETALPCADAGEASAMAPPVSILKSSLPTGFAAIIGMLQRVLLSCPDKAPARAQVAASICLIVKAMVSPVNHKKHSVHGADPASATHVDIQNIKLAADLFLSFTASIIKSSKVARRSFAVEVAALLLRLPNIWYIVDTMAQEDVAFGKGVSGAHMLLLSMFGRCRDIAATVRTRALAAVAAILDDLGQAFGNHHEQDKMEGDAGCAQHFNGFPLELCQSLYRLIVEESFADNTDSAQNFMETLKLLAQDEKPTTRMKALRAYGTALSIRWPKIDSSYYAQPLSEVETISMLVTDDDVSMFVKGCTDSSVSVRKQAVDSITDLMLSRPVDSFLQDSWVTAVLPLIFDPEATVQQKVAQSVFSLVIDTSVAWVQHEKNPSNGVDVSHTLRSLGWVLCSKLVQAGLYKMLKHSIPELLKSGHLSVSTSGSTPRNSINVKELVMAMEFACTLNLGPETNRQRHLNGSDDRDVVSHSSWIILEALIDNENAQSGGSGLKCCSDFDALYKSDFVILCWEARMSSSVNSSMGSCTDDVRILRVLESMASRNIDLCRSPRFKAVCTHLVKNISDMTCQSSAVAAALAVLLAPMTCFKNNDSSRKSSTGASSLTSMGLNDPSFTDWFDDILQTIGNVLNIAYSVLHEALVGWSTDALREGLFGGPVAPIPRSGASRGSSWSNEGFGESDVAVSVVNAAIFVVGEISMLGFSADEEDVFSLLASPKTLRRPSYAISKLSNGAYKILIPEVLVKLMQMLMPNFLPPVGSMSINFSQTQEDDNFGGSGSDHNKRIKIPTSVRANSFIAVGKLCVRDKARASKCVNIFLRELQMLDSSEVAVERSAAVRSNALLILGDLCVRFTNLVDRHIGILASCLQDDEVIVRKNAFVLLVQLLVQDFLKWRGMLLYRFLAIVVDSDEDMAEFGKLALKKALDGKFSGIFKQHFVEAVVILNDCRDHPAFAANETSGGNDGGGECLVDLRGVDLSGPSNRSRRMQVYEFIMDGMSEEDKIQTTAKLVHDILAYAVDHSHIIRSQMAASAGSVSSSALTPMEETIADTFRILRSPMLKVGIAKKSSIEDDIAVDGETFENASQAMQSAKIKVLKKLSVQHMIEHVLPVVSSLKHSLERCRSQLQRPLMEYLCEIVRNHKSEVGQVLAHDPCLKAEIEYDMRMFEKMKETVSQRARLEAAEMAADSALNDLSARKSFGGRISCSDCDSKSKSIQRRKSFAGLSIAKSPALKKSLIDNFSADCEEIYLADALNDSSNSAASPVQKRWSVSLSHFADQNMPEAVHNQKVATEIPQGNLRYSYIEKSDIPSLLPVSGSIDRSDGSSPMKKRSKASTKHEDNLTLADKPLRGTRRTGRNQNILSDSLISISK